MIRWMILALLSLAAGCQTAAPADPKPPASEDCEQRIDQHTSYLRDQGFFPTGPVRISSDGHMYYVLEKVQGDDPVFLYVVASSLGQDEVLLSHGFAAEFGCSLDGQKIYIYTRELDPADQDGA
jgi:hypothetical protein